MSKSLNINAPQIVQTRNTLNAVPSGSTATPDENVKYVPQDLTDAQKAQARENIGAVSANEVAQANWNETDTESPSYIQNKPTIPAAQVQSDWNQSDDTAVDYIKNKPSISGKNDIPDEYIGIWKIHFQIPGSRQAYADWSDNLSRVINTWQRGVELGSNNRRVATGWNAIQFREYAREHVQNFDMSNNAISANILIHTYIGGTVLSYNFSTSTKYNGKVNVFIYPEANNDNATWKTWGSATTNAHNVKFYCMTNVWPAGWDNIYADIVYVDGVDFTAISGQTYTLPSTLNTPGIWVPNSKKAEYLTFLATTYPNEDVSVFTNKTFYYDFITWMDDHTPQMITLG